MLNLHQRLLLLVLEHHIRRRPHQTIVVAMGTGHTPPEALPLPFPLLPRPPRSPQQPPPTPQISLNRNLLRTPLGRQGYHHASRTLPSLWTFIRSQAPIFENTLWVFSMDKRRRRTSTDSVTVATPNNRFQHLSLDHQAAKERRPITGGMTLPRVSFPLPSLPAVTQGA